MLALPLSGCIFSDSSLYEEYGTPEKLFGHEFPEIATALSNSLVSKQSKDVGLTVKAAIMEALPFASSSKPTGTLPQEFSTYYHLIANATSGPNYAQMLLYVDGNVVIDVKPSLGQHRYTYFHCDVSVAERLNDLIRLTILSSEA